MPKTRVQTDKAPAAGGPYSQAIVANGFVFTAGQVATIPGTRNLVEGGVQEQTRQVLNNVKAILEAAGSSLNSVVKTTVFLQNVEDFQAMNEVYATFFTGDTPARSTVAVRDLPLKGALVEIETIALLEK
jgi:2-iminobutanoate/2-iminopropanoate deaminase